MLATIKRTEILFTTTDGINHCLFSYFLDRFNFPACYGKTVLCIEHSLGLLAGAGEE